MKTTIRTPLIAFIAVLAALGAAGAQAATETETVHQTFDLAPGGTLVVGNVNGEITLEGWDQPQVEMEATKKVRAGSSEAAREGLRKLQIEIDQAANRVEVRTRHPKGSSGWFSGNSNSGSVRYHLKVPAGLILEITTVNGSIEAEGLEGQLDLRSTNGAIEVASSSGSVNASTTNGRIRVGLQQVAEAEDQSFSTTNGSISLELPHDYQADLHASTVNGSIETDLPIAIEGKVSRRKLDGKINGGGPRLRLSTTNGSIRLTSR